MRPSVDVENNIVTASMRALTTKVSCVFHDKWTHCHQACSRPSKISYIVGTIEWLSPIFAPKFKVSRRGGMQTFAETRFLIRYIAIVLLL